MTIIPSKVLDYIIMEEGLTRNNSGAYTYEYNLKDHLGSTRVVFQPIKGEPTIIQKADYYPFGATFNPINPNNNNKYLYNGKEKQDDVLSGTALDWYDYGARFYDPMIGRWHSVDEKAEEYYGWSPYNYVTNDPIKMIDPDGRSGEVGIDEKNKTVTIKVNLVIYGNAASAVIANQYAAKAQAMWNAAKGTVKIGGEVYSVAFKITGEYREDGDKLKNEILNNKDVKNNYFRVDQTTDKNGDSYYDENKAVDKEGGNSGYYSRTQVSKNDLTTVAHELGHTFGLKHLSTDQRSAIPPSIMTTADNWGPPGFSEGGYVNPSLRQVTKGDINSLGLNKLQYDKTGKSSLGSLTNYYHKFGQIYKISK